MLDSFLPEEEREIGGVTDAFRYRLIAGTDMEKDTLSAIIQIEREIRERLTQEQRKAEESLAEVLRNCNDEVAREEARLQGDLAAAVTAAGLRDARKRADTLVTEALAQAERLAGLDDERLKRLIRGELPRLVPGKTT
jgi:hypothetical protein